MDDLDKLIAKRTQKNSNFPNMVKAAERQQSIVKRREKLREIDKSVHKLWILFCISLFICLILYTLIGNPVINNSLLIIGCVLYTLLTGLLFIGNTYLSILRRSCWKLHKTKEENNDKETHKENLSK
jgi:Flp pilus assembly protein TadB